MKLAVGSDHRGFAAKQKLIPLLRQWGHEIVDFGCDASSPAVDYPDHAIPVARAVAAGACDAGILFGGSGIGMSMAANKVVGVRAALAHDEVAARVSREHHHSNVLCLAADLNSETHMKTIVEVFLKTPYGDGRHLRRVNKLIEHEQRLLDGPPATPSPKSRRSPGH